MMAQRMHHCALIRSLTGFDGSHNAHMALTGFATGTTTHGAVVTRLDLPPQPVAAGEAGGQRVAAAKRAREALPGGECGSALVRLVLVV